MGGGIFMLITAYSAMVVDTLTGILTARLSTDEASANQILSRVQSFPYVFSGAFGAAINVLGSRYLGESDDARYLNLGFALIATSLLIGGVCAVVIYAAARSIFGIYTDDTAVRYVFLLLLPRRSHCVAAVAICHVEAVPHAQFPHLLRARIVRVYVQLVHEEAKLVFAIEPTKLL